MDTITSAEEDSIPSQVEIDIVYPSALKPGRKRGRPQGSKNLPTFEARRVNKKLLAQAHYERNKAVDRVAAETKLDVGSATNPGRKRGRPRGSKNRPNPQPLKTDEQLLSQAHDERKGERTSLDGLSAAKPGEKRGRPRGSKNRPKTEPLKGDEQLLSQAHDEAKEEGKYLGGLSAASPGRKRGRPRGSKNRPKPEHPKADEQLQSQRYHDREKEPTYLAEVATPVSFSDKRQQHVARLLEHEMQENASSEVDKLWGRQRTSSPCPTDSGINHARDLRSSPKSACSPDKPSRQREQYKRLDLPGPSNVPYKDAADIAASQQWRADRENQARRFAQLEKFLEANDQESNVGSEPRRRRCQRVSAHRVNLDKEKLDEMAMIEGDTQGSCTNNDTSSDNSDGSSDDGELHGSASWVPLSVASRPVGFLGQVRQDVGFLPKSSGRQVGVLQPIMY